jgi:hypothetical protein
MKTVIFTKNGNETIKGELIFRVQMNGRRKDSFRFTTYSEVLSSENGEVVRRVNVTDKSERLIERTERGMLMMTDTDRFFVNTNETIDDLETI